MAYRTSQEPDRRPRATHWFAGKTTDLGATASGRWQHPDEQSEGGSAPFLTELLSRAVTAANVPDDRHRG